VNIMLSILLGGLIAVSGAAAPVKTLVRNEDKTEDNTDETTLVGHPPVQWLKTYTLPIYQERWRLEGAVKHLDTGLSEARQVFAKLGASEVERAETTEGGKARRLTYRCPQKSAQLALQELKKVGVFAPPAVRPIVEPVSLPEVQAKIAALEADKNAHTEQLATMPAVSALLDELLGHLRGVESSVRKHEVEVLIHLTLREKA